MGKEKKGGNHEGVFMVVYGRGVHGKRSLESVGGGGVHEGGGRKREKKTKVE